MAAGATLLYSHGGVTDSHMMRGGKVEVIGQMLDLIKAEGLPAGVGGHSLNMPMACEENKLDPDFYVKTFHMDRYWSATPAEAARNTTGCRWMCQRRRQLRQHVVQQPRGDSRLHGQGQQALGSL